MASVIHSRTRKVISAMHWREATDELISGMQDPLCYFEISEKLISVGERSEQD